MSAPHGAHSHSAEVSPRGAVSPWMKKRTEMESTRPTQPWPHCVAAVLEPPVHLSPSKGTSSHPHSGTSLDPQEMSQDCDSKPPEPASYKTLSLQSLWRPSIVTEGSGLAFTKAPSQQAPVSSSGITHQRDSPLLCSLLIIVIQLEFVSFKYEI